MPIGCPNIPNPTFLSRFSIIRNGNVIFYGTPLQKGELHVPNRMTFLINVF